VGAIALLWPQRSSALSLWLLVAQWAWLIETMLLLLDHDRFSVFWYGGIFGQIASCFLVVALLYETTTLYARVAMNDVVNEAQRAGDIIRSINATLEGARSPAVALSIDALVNDALKLLRSELRTHDVTVELEVASNLLVLGHRSQLVQVLVNLITNAIEAMADVKDRLRRLTIRAQLDPSSKVSIEVTDSGGGIDGEDTARIFDPFFTTKSRGTGLGLAICRQIIESHDGDISATAADHGAVFQIILPSA
jgi:C4-dicarboxylate-specific signal transduction histidine kinase